MKKNKILAWSIIMVIIGGLLTLIVASGGLVELLLIVGFLIALIVVIGALIWAVEQLTNDTPD